jgi:CheY-like chemotaxis protein
MMRSPAAVTEAAISPRAQSLMAERFQSVVMVVDDSEFERKLVDRILASALYDVMFADSGAQALSLLRHEYPDLILMDMDMPVMTGLDTLRKLKSTLRWSSIPVMMITGNSEKALVVQCFKAGAVDFAVKPLERESFLSKVARYLPVH